MTIASTVTTGMRRRWWQTLTVALALGYLVIGVLSPSPAIRWPLLIGAVLVLGAVTAIGRSRPLAWTALVVGALAPVATTWWSVAAPVTSLLILGCGTAAIRGHRNATVAVPRRQEG